MEVVIVQEQAIMGFIVLSLTVMIQHVIMEIVYQIQAFQMILTVIVELDTKEKDVTFQNVILNHAMMTTVLINRIIHFK